MNKTIAVRNSWLPCFINKWLVCCALWWLIGWAWHVLEPDEFNTVPVAGELQSISAHEKLRSMENVKKRVKEEQRAVLETQFFLLSKDCRHTLSIRSNQSHVWSLFEDCFSTLVVRKTRSGQRRLHFLRQTARAGLENPRSLCYGGWVWQVVIRFSFCLPRAPFPASSFGRYRRFT